MKIGDSFPKANVIVTNDQQLSVVLRDKTGTEAACLRHTWAKHPSSLRLLLAFTDAQNIKVTNVFVKCDANGVKEYKPWHGLSAHVDR